MTNIVVPVPIPGATLPLPDSADLPTWPARMKETHYWMRMVAAPGMSAAAESAYQNALHAVAMADSAVAAANFKGAWSGLTGALNMPASVSHSGRLWLLTANLANVTTATPGVSGSWMDVTNFLMGVSTALAARTALDVYSKAESDAAPPTYAGAVIQCVTATDAGSSTTSTALVNVSGAVVPVTPKSTSSKLLITCVFQGSSAAFAGANTLASFRIFENTTALGTGEMTIGASTASGGTGSSSVTTVQATVTNTALTTRNFKLHAKTSNASSAAGATLQNWTITEIKT